MGNLHFILEQTCTFHVSSVVLFWECIFYTSWMVISGSTHFNLFMPFSWLLVHMPYTCDYGFIYCLGFKEIFFCFHFYVNICIYTYWPLSDIYIHVYSYLFYNAYIIYIFLTTSLHLYIYTYYLPICILSLQGIISIQTETLSSSLFH